MPEKAKALELKGLACHLYASNPPTCTDTPILTKLSAFSGGTRYGEATWGELLAQAPDSLARVNLLLEKLRHLFRLAKDLHYLDLRRYECCTTRAARATDEIGRLVGGGLKAGWPGGATVAAATVES